MQRGATEKAANHRKRQNCFPLAYVVLIFRCGSACDTNAPVVISLVLKPWLPKSTEHLLLRRADSSLASGATDVIIHFRIVGRAMSMQIL